MSLSIICIWAWNICDALVKHMEHTSATCETCIYGMCFETFVTSLWNICNIPVLIMFQCVYDRCSCLVMQVSVYVTSFLCLTSLSIYSDPWKSFMKFGIKKSHEMISHILLKKAWLSEWNYRSLTKLCNFAQMTLQQKSWRVHVEQMSRKCPDWSKTLV
jgi:hypothetical protein